MELIKSRTWGEAQWGKCLLYENEDSNSVRNPCEKLGVVVRTCNPCTEGQMGILGN